MSAGEAPGEGTSPSRRSIISAYARSRAGRLALTSGILVVSQSSVLILPVVTGMIYDQMTGGSISDVALLMGLIFASLGLSSLASVLGQRLYSRLYRSFAADLRTRIMGHLQRLSVAFYARTGAAVVQTKLVRDVEAVETMLQLVLPLLATVAVTGVGAIVITAFRTPAFLLVFLLTVPFAVILTRVFQRRITGRNERLRREVESLSATIGEVGTMIAFDRAHGLERVAQRQVDAAADRVRTAGIGVDVLTAGYTAGLFVTFQGLWTVVVGAGAVLSLAGLVPVTGGELIMLVSFFGNLTRSVTTLMELAPVIARGQVSARSIGDLLAEADVEPNEGGLVPTEVRGHVRFEGVTLRYPGASEDAVSRLSLDFAPGEVVALVGPSGGGKSTIVNLALGLIRPSAGRVTIDGHDVAKLDMRVVRSFVSVVSQEPVFFDGTVAQNLAHGLPDVGEAAIRQALADAYADQFVDRLPDGIHSPIGSRGALLSGGQRQRLAIARALIRNPRILALDEATSALDGESERLVKAALDRLMRGRTCIVVAHRLSTIRSADRIVVIDRGRAVESGTHDELLARGGRYASLHDAQGDADLPIAI